MSIQRSAPPRLALLAGLLLSALLCGCGFQLRGASVLPESVGPVLIQAPAGAPIGAALAQAVQTGGAAITGSPAEARTIVRVHEASHEHRVTAVNSAGKVIAYEILYRVTFDAVRRDGSQAAARQTLVLTREYVNPDIEVLGKAEEAELIRQDMLIDMADRILRRLGAQLG